MSALITLRPSDPSASRRAAWRSPATIPRPQLAAVFAVCAVFAVTLTLVTSNHLHRLWAVFAACSYVLAAASVFAWKSRGADLALAVSLGDALMAPLGMMAADRLGQPEVWVISQSAAALTHHGTPYPGAAALAAARSPNAFDPYLPIMTVFGLPRALLGLSAATDPRIWFGVLFIAAFAAALAIAGVRDVARWTALMAASPVIAFPLTVGGTDVPVLALLCLGLALLWRRELAGTGLVLGAAAAMKATAWPALLVASALVAARDGRRAAARMSALAGGVALAVVGLAAARQPGSFLENTIEFPLGLAHVRSEAVSPLLGHLLTDTGRVGHLLAVGSLTLAGLAFVGWLLIRPPRTVPAATWRLIAGLTGMFVLAPATRFGYFVYPIGLLIWLEIVRRGQAPDPPGGSGPRRAGRLPPRSWQARGGLRLG